MGKTADGKLKWRPTTPYNDDWGSGTFGDYDGPKYDKDDEGNRLVDEAKMDQWSAWLCPCGSDMADCFDGCCVCGNWSEGEAEDSEVDELCGVNEAEARKLLMHFEEGERESHRKAINLDQTHSSMSKEENQSSPRSQRSILRTRHYQQSPPCRGMTFTS